MPTLTYPIDIIEDDLFFRPKLNFFIKPRDGMKQSIAFKYNTVRNNLVDLKFYFPKEFAESNSFETVMSSCFNGNKFVYSPKTSHELWITDIEHQNIEKKEVKSYLIHLQL